MQMNRRALLGGLGGLVVGGAVAGLAGSVAQAAEAQKKAPLKDASAAPAVWLTRFGEATKPFSWEPRRLDLKEVASVGHAGFHHQGFG